MDAEPPLDYLLDQPAGPGASTPGRDELVAIVARSHARRTRVAALGMAATLAVGGLGGWLISASSRPSGRATLAAGRTTTVAPKAGPLTAPAGAGPAIAVLGGDTELTRVFVRTTAGGVTIRAYQSAVSAVPAIPFCSPLSPGLQVEVSTAAVAEGAFALLSSAPAPLKGYSVTTAGMAEGAPVWVVTVHGDANVALVRATFAGGGTDQMAPVNGWAVLAHAVAAPSAVPVTGSIEVLNTSGAVIGRVAVTLAGAAYPSPPPKQPPGAGAGGGAVPATGSASASGSATASGSTTVPVPPGGAVTSPPAPGVIGIAPVPPCLGRSTGSRSTTATTGG